MLVPGFVGCGREESSKKLGQIHCRTTSDKLGPNSRLRVVCFHSSERTGAAGDSVVVRASMLVVFLVVANWPTREGIDDS